MKTVLFAAALGLLAAGPLAHTSAGADSPPPRTSVVFDHPEKFTDVKDMYTPTEKGEKYILRQINDFVVQVGDRLMPGGYHLAMTFQDIDLAGDFEPWHGPQWEDVRVIKDIYPPRFKFTYAVTDPAGKVVRHGDENIVDLGFEMQPILDHDDPLRYEKSFLGSWMRTHLARVRG